MPLTCLAVFTIARSVLHFPVNYRDSFFELEAMLRNTDILQYKAYVLQYVSLFANIRLSKQHLSD